MQVAAGQLSKNEVVLALLGEEKEIQLKHLQERLGGNKQDRVALSELANQLLHDGVLTSPRDGFIDIRGRNELVRGKVSATTSGYGFLAREDGEDDVFVPADEMNPLLHGDQVVARINPRDVRGRVSCSIVAIERRAHNRLVGKVTSASKSGVYVTPENKKIQWDFFVQNGKPGGLKASVGQVVMIDIIAYPDPDGSIPAGVITEVIGHEDDDGIEIEIALRNHELPVEFSAAALAENSALPDSVLESDIEGRRSLIHLPLVTIDGETAKDFDDAVYCEKAGKDWRLVVAIADVSHYVRPGMALDTDAKDRGTSVYFPRRVIPMLPEKLSNGICSLNPNVQRLAMVCDAVISKKGEILSYEFYPAVFRSHARLTYTQVWDWLSAEGKPDASHQALMPHLNNLYHLYKVLVGARSDRGAIDFEAGETRMVFDEHGKIAEITKVVRNDAHRLIEECMLVANVCAAAFLAENEHECLYRVHEGPTPERLAGLRSVLGELGLQLGGGDKPKAKDYANLVESIKERPDAQTLQTLALRSLRRAQYTAANVGHFGLSYDHYTHFTSPIRRYPDLLVHRAIKAILAGERYEPGDWEEIGQHCSDTERRADDASRDVEAWLKCHFMKDRVGEEFDAHVSSVAQFGVFVALDDIYVEGMIRVTDLGDDYFSFDKQKHEMLGTRTGKRYRLGDKLRVRLDRVDMDEAQMTFMLASTEAPKPEKPEKKAQAGFKFGNSRPWKQSTH